MPGLAPPRGLLAPPVSAGVDGQRFAGAGGATAARHGLVRRRRWLGWRRTGVGVALPPSLGLPFPSSEVGSAVATLHMVVFGGLDPGSPSVDLGPHRLIWFLAVLWGRWAPRRKPRVSAQDPDGRAGACRPLAGSGACTLLMWTSSFHMGGGSPGWLAKSS